VLLTRSRLCPRPKPGSSLHLHVLGTPPAFVLSQDQTLREELLRRVVRSTTPYIQLGPRSQPATGQVLGPSLVGPDPCTHTPQAKPSVGAQVHSRASGVQDGVNLGTAVRANPEGFRSSDGVEPGHTPRPRNRSKGAHAVEFSKTVAPLQEGIPPQTARPEPVNGSRGGPTSIALEIALNTEFALPGRTERRSADAQLTTWTATVRCRGRSSKSIRTICCQVPSVRRPSTNGIDSEGPISAAR
jgi:hypothetical protein